MRYYISDCHFFHSAINVRMDQRGFGTVEEMNEYMIKQWNSRVRKNDEIVILGDLSFGNVEETESLVKRLKGKKTLITGNHDKYVKDNRFDTSLFAGIYPYLELNDDRRKVVLCHYPVFCYNGQNRIDADGKPKVYMLYGHVHNTYDEVLVDQFIQLTKKSTREIGGTMQNIPCEMINCFCVFSDYIPMTLDEWILIDKQRRLKNRETKIEQK